MARANFNIDLTEQYHTILENIPYLAWLKDTNGKYLVVNSPFAKSYGLTKDKIIGKLILICAVRRRPANSIKVMKKLYGQKRDAL